MNTAHILLGLIAALALGGVGWLLVVRGRLIAQVVASEGLSVRAEEERSRFAAGAETLRADLDAARADLAAQALALERARGDATRQEEVMAERLRAADRREAEFREQAARRDEQMGERFKAAAAETLRSAKADFLQLAEQRLATQQQQSVADLDRRREAVDQLVRPIGETLKRTDDKLAALEKEWAADRAGLAEQIRGMSAAGESLRAETHRLAKALSKPEVRGRYGEIQLRRVAELAGMVAYCDFCEQASQRDDGGRLLRPDMVVRLPNDRVIAVDAKTNTYAYLEAIDAKTDVERDECLDRFARHVADQAQALSKKGYWSELDGSPDFVVMFIPGDQFLDAALARRSDLLDKAAEQNVILASPATLIGLLRAVAVGWREKRVEQEAKELFALGRELHDRAATAFGFVARMGESLDTATRRYNDLVGSLESRFQPTLRKFEEAGVKSGKEIAAPVRITIPVRPIERLALRPGSVDGHPDGAVG